MNERTRILDIATATAAVAAVAFAFVAEHEPPDLLAVALFTGVLFAAENTQVLLPHALTVSPGFMLIMAAIVVIGGPGGVVGTAVVAGMGSLSIGRLRARRFSRQVFHSSQYVLAAALAAVSFEQVTVAGGGRLGAAIAATVAFALVNTGLVLGATAVGEEVSVREVWTDMRSDMPNYLAFGLLGVPLGQLYLGVGWLSLPLMIVPVVVGRKTFGASLKLRAAHDATMQVFIRAIEAKDPYTAGHTERVAVYARYMGEELAFSTAQLDHLRCAALMHDIGKLAVPSRLLNKPGRLTADEYARVQRHNLVGVDILTRVDFMKTMVDSASDRHAHYAGTARRRLAQLEFEAHIVAVADAFDAMTSTRSYRRALPQDVAFAELRRNAGTQFNPDCVEALIRVIERRGERYGLGYEVDPVRFAVAPPVTGTGSAGLGDLLQSGTARS